MLFETCYCLPFDSYSIETFHWRLCKRSSNSIFAPLTVLRIHESMFVSFHLLIQKSIFPAVKFLLDTFNEFFLLFAYVSKFFVDGVSSLHLDTMSWFVLVLFGMNSVVVSSSVFLLEPSSLPIKMTDSYFYCLSSQTLCYLEVLSLNVQSQIC